MINTGRLIENAAGIGVTITEEQAEITDRFCEMVFETNKLFNLTAIKEADDMEEKNALDSLSVLPYIPQNSVMADVGTGAGFPGVVVAVTRPDVQVTLIEATDKKLQFAVNAAAKLNHPVTGVHCRGEEAGRAEYREKFDVVTARAVAALPTLLEFCLPLVKVGGRFVAMKGAGAKAEAEASGNALKLLGGKITETHTFSLPSAGERTIFVIEKVKQTPPKYPRASTKIKKDPLGVVVSG